MERLQEPPNPEDMSLPGMVINSVAAVGANIANGVKNVWSKYAPSFLTRKQESHSAASFRESLQEVVGEGVEIPNFSTEQFDEILDQ